jgi:hypothetical protein
MLKIRITVGTIGHMPSEFNRQKIRQWRSSVFEITNEIESYALAIDSDGPEWDFTDQAIQSVLPSNFSGDFFVAIVNVPLELNWYSRRINGNRVVFTFHEIKDILRYSNIPLENVIYRLLYAYTLLYKRSSNTIPVNTAHTDYTHDETRGCLFDMNGIKSDVIFSCHNPIICPDCTERLRRETVSDDIISKCKNEIKKIRKTLFYRITDFIKQHPLWSLTISAVTAIILGVIGSLIASYVYELIKQHA